MSYLIRLNSLTLFEREFSDASATLFGRDASLYQHVQPLSTTKSISGEKPVSLPLPSENVAKETEGVD